MTGAREMGSTGVTTGVRSGGVSTASGSFAWYVVREYVFPHGVRRLAVAVRRRLSGGWRTTEVSKQINEDSSRGLRQEFERLTADELYDRVLNYRHQQGYLLKADMVVYGDKADIEPYLHEQLAAALGLSAGSNERILEFGCAQGRNLFWLKTRYPQLSLVGVDIAEEGIRLGEELATTFRLAVSLATLRDHRLPFPDESFDMAFTWHCLEQCPSTYQAIVQELLRVTRRRLVLLEPMDELYPWTVRGFFSRLHGFYNDYARGLYGYLCRVAVVREARRLCWASNALNETCLVVAEKRPCPQP